MYFFARNFDLVIVSRVVKFYFENKKITHQNIFRKVRSLVTRDF